MRAPLLVLVPALALLTGCPPAGDCQVDADCGDGFACRESAEGGLVCIQVVDTGDGGPSQDVGILTFVADPAVVASGGTSTLTWTTENATSCALSGGLGAVDTNGSLEVTVDDTTEFALNCQGDNGPVGERVTVAVEVAIETFTATPADVDELGEVTLAWTAVGADSCQLTYGTQVDLAVDASADHTFVPGSSDDATLTCQGANGPVTDTAAIRLARITALTATPPAIAVGQSTTLAWTAENATACAINGETDPNPDDDQLVVSPTATQSYSLRCTGFQGELRRDIESVVLITAWAPAAASVASGEDAVFNFTLDQRVASCELDDATAVDIGTGSVTISAITADVTHTLTCQDGDGLTATSESATVTVQ
jgi:hypothetical protein